MRTLAGLLCVLIVPVSGIMADTYGLNPSDGKDTVYFRSSAKLEFVEGKTNDINGSFTVDPGNVANQVSGIIRVDLRTLKTGIDMRDEHMRTRHLETDKYPYAYFELTGVSGLPQELAQGRTEKGTAQGWFYIHGVKKKLEAPIEVTRQVDPTGKDAVIVRTKFAMNLDEWHIPRPRALFLKLAETIDVECIFSGSKDLGGTPVELPDWAELK